MLEGLEGISGVWWTPLNVQDTVTLYPTPQVHGFTDKAMHIYIGTSEDPLRIVRGGIFGGTLPRIECVLRAYIIALHQTLTDGYVGTEECIWAIIFARLPHLFAG